MAGFARGTIMVHKILKSLHPSILAALYNSSGYTHCCLVIYIEYILAHQGNYQLLVYVSIHPSFTPMSPKLGIVSTSPEYHHSNFMNMVNIWSSLKSSL